ncbi:hypothetical protein BLA50215_07633 [Burkholderia lata]|nr:hypothetical protein BLA50215_07633 [Burkholderia lata]
MILRDVQACHTPPSVDFVHRLAQKELDALLKSPLNGGADTTRQSEVTSVDVLF